MNQKEMIGKVHSSVYHQCQERGYAAPVDVLIDVGVLTKENYEDWRYGRVQYLEKVCSANLHKLSFIMQQMRAYAKKAGYKESFCYYKRWGVKSKGGQKPRIKLRFSKSGDESVERWYGTHFVDSKRIAELKAEKHQAPEEVDKERHAGQKAMHDNDEAVSILNRCGQNKTEIQERP